MWLRRKSKGLKALGSEESGVGLIKPGFWKSKFGEAAEAEGEGEEEEKRRGSREEKGSCMVGKKGSENRFWLG